MTKKYETLKTILSWCKQHPNRDTFYYFEIGINTRSIAALCDTPFKGRVWLRRRGVSCDTPFKGRVWLRRRGVSEKRDATHGLMRYALSTNVELLIDLFSNNK
jgi:hypothetical protein